MVDSYRRKALITRVIDGDTVKAVVDLGFGINYQPNSFRLAGIDCPELRKDPEKAQAAKKYVEEQILNKEVEFKSLKTGKFGRFLVFIYVDGNRKSLNDELVEKGFAKPYDKGKRISKPKNADKPEEKQKE